MKQQNGYKLIEVLIALFLLALLAGGGFLIYAIWHFVAKFW